MSEENKDIETPEIVDPEHIELLEEDIEDEVNESGSESERLNNLLLESDERYLRVLAEYENYRKRTSKERGAIYPAAIAETTARFLPVLDNFERALEFDCSTDEFVQGMDLISQNFKDVLESLGAEELGKVGEKFDPEFHNAIMHTEDKTLGENVISKVLQKGYKIGDRVLRHAVVETAN